MEAKQVVKTIYMTIKNWIAIIADLWELLDTIWNEFLHLNNCNFEEGSTSLSIEEANKEIQNLWEVLSKLRNANVEDQSL